ncbi:tetratricopeptide repeat protein [Halobacteriovorax vibrionivorans]|uniref:Tetratricopeptide repeat protein n=1 Tax=Halobacteriovorax vibrionivorans TaxID=2152716 RepID=A0ABY0IDV5_9BACT|nr:MULTISPECIES: tetratricopeptide repeat protein [Halobacteriovorax]RZF21143.1 tetratricopeptide repeat protein [Halobacteriovorax vibrionivorans]TGD46260.1 tetratricopeptide repeat protein [Halobacteriovorax sp. Y22]
MSNEDSRKQTFFKDLEVLVVESLGNARVAYENAFKSLGIERKNVRFAKTFHDALKELDSFEPNLVFSYEVLDQGRYNDVLKKHLKLQPNRINNSFILLTQNDSIDAISKIAQQQVDLVLPIPFTVDSIKALMDKLYEMKSSPSDYRKLINAAYEQVGKDHAKVFEIVEKARELSKGPYETYYLEGLCHFKDKNFEESLKALEKSYTINPKDFNTLKLFFKTYKHQKNYYMALQYSLKLHADYPISPDMLKDLSMVAVAAGKHELILNYYDAYKKVNEPSDEIKDAISAAIVIYARCELEKIEFDKSSIQDLQKNKKYLKALKLIEEASIICATKPAILEKMIIILTQTPDNKTTKFVQVKQKEKFPKYENAPLMDALVADKDSTASQSLKMAIDTLNSGFKSEELFEIIIKRSVDMNRKEESIQEWYEQAIKIYPHMKSRLNKFYNA